MCSDPINCKKISYYKSSLGLPCIPPCEDLVGQWRVSPCIPFPIYLWCHSHQPETQPAVLFKEKQEAALSSLPLWLSFHLQMLPDSPLAGFQGKGASSTAWIPGAGMKDSGDGLDFLKEQVGSSARELWAVTQQWERARHHTNPLQRGKKARKYGCTPCLLTAQEFKNKIKFHKKEQTSLRKDLSERPGLI